MDYHWFRAFADSWGLVAMAAFFLGALIYAFRPGSKSLADEAADIPFKDD